MNFFKAFLRGLCVIVFWTVILSPIFALNAQTDANDTKQYSESITEIGKEIRKITRNLNANQILLKTEQDTLSDLERKIVVQRTELERTKKSVENLDALLLQIEKEGSVLKEHRQKDLAAYRELIKAQYMNEQSSFLKMALNQENPYAVGRLNNYYDYFARAREEKLTEIRKKLTELSNFQESKTKVLSELSDEAGKQQTLFNQLERSKKTRNDAVARLSKKVESSNKKIDQLNRDRERLDSLIQQIAKQAKRLKAIEQKRRLEEQQRNQIAKPNDNVKVIRPLVKGGFKKQKGRLSYPVQATQVYGFGSRVPESGMRAQGVFFKTQGSEPVRSIFRGRVLFSDYLKGYGLLLIIDHGDEHISLYGHNELIYKGVGDIVETSEVIAKSGVSGGLKSAGVYFEIRENAAPVNPATWCQ
jgi:septal ring factor EnvC (AmiA/AmiB activator)